MQEGDSELFVCIHIGAENRQAAGFNYLDDEDSDNNGGQDNDGQERTEPDKLYGMRFYFNSPSDLAAEDKGDCRQPQAKPGNYAPLRLKRMDFEGGKPDCKKPAKHEKTPYIQVVSRGFKK